VKTIVTDLDGSGVGSMVAGLEELDMIESAARVSVVSISKESVMNLRVAFSENAECGMENIPGP